MSDLRKGCTSDSAQYASEPFLLTPSMCPDRAKPEAGLLSDPEMDAALMSDAEVPEKTSSILEDISLGLSPTEIRSLSQTLLKLADAVDQRWSPARVQSKYHWLSHAGRIERNAMELAKTAVWIQELGRRRERHIPAETVGEPSWQMLLELFIQFAGGAKVSTKSLCVISGCPDTTALRQIDHLEAAGFVQRSQSPEDKRVTLVELTRKGVIAVGSALKDIGT